MSAEEERLARLVPLDAPRDETELAFWRRKAAERGKRVAELETEVFALRRELRRLQEEAE